MLPHARLDALPQTAAHAPLWREALPHLDELRSAARRYAGARRDLADDLMQETFLRALAAADRYRPGSNARAWLHAILTNAARSNFRRERRDLRLRERFEVEPSRPREVAAPSLLPSLAVLPGGRAAVGAASPRAAMTAPAPAPTRPSLSSLVAELPPGFREVVELVDLQGLSYREVAERVGCPVGTVMSRLHRARRRLRARMDVAPAERSVAISPPPVVAAARRR